MNIYCLMGIKQYVACAMIIVAAGFSYYEHVKQRMARDEAKYGKDN